MPNTESTICRSTAPCLGVESEPKKVTPQSGIPSGCVIPFESMAEFYKSKEKYSYPIRLFEIINREFNMDRIFPAHSSLGDCRAMNEGNNYKIEWKRPHEITTNPKFFVDGGSSNLDIVQGLLKNCWFLAAVASLAERRDLLENVVPMYQNFDEAYACLFHFRFWQYGKWVDVVVDDYLPTYMTSEDNKPKLKLFGAQPASGNIFWLPLLEKAYAKLHGSYQAIEGPQITEKALTREGTGLPSDAMEDFTGGISEYYSSADEAVKKLGCFKFSQAALKNESLVTCYFENCLRETEEKFIGRMRPNHWSITRFDSIEKKWFAIIRYPGDKNHKSTTELNENWKDNEGITKQSLESYLKTNPLKNGEFIMSEAEFDKRCTSMEICHLNLSQLSSFDAGKKWQLCEFDGEWSGNSAGGSTKGGPPPTFETNPRYHFELKNEGNVIIALMQKYQWKNDPTGDLLEIGFDIYFMDEYRVIPYPLDEKTMANKVELEKHKANHNLKNTEAITAPDSMQFQAYTRESNCRLKLSPGYYCIVVHTRQRCKTGNFFLRIFSNAGITMQKDTQWEMRNSLKPYSNGTYKLDTDNQMPSSGSQRDGKKI